MRKAFASLTATAVASARALATGNAGTLADPHDTVARRLLPSPLALAVEAVESTRVGQRVLSPLLVRISLGMVDHLALRCVAIDALLCAALEQGVSQVVIIGAGLDGRAHRLQALRDAVVYEVDHPASQRTKRARAARLQVAAKALHYVPVDLAQNALGPALQQAGFEPATRSFTIIEGVLPYLAHGQVAELLHQLANVTAQGSELVLSYVPAGAAWMRLSRWLVGPSLRAIGEPLGDLPTPAVLGALLSEHGFTVERDATPAELAPRAPGTPPGTARAEPRVAYERMVHAFRR